MFNKLLLSNNLRFISLILGLALIAFPTSKGLIINGLPFNNQSEIIIFTIFIPIVYLSKIFNKIYLIILSFFIIIKILSAFTLDEGFIIKQSLINQSNNEIEVINYDSFFFKKNSILNNGIKDFKEMPFSWINFTDPFTGKNIEGPTASIEDYKIKLRLNGFFLLNENQQININLNNIENPKIKIFKIDNSKEVLISRLITNEIHSKELEPGLYKINGYLHSTQKKTWIEITNSIQSKIEIYQNQNIKLWKIYFLKILSISELLLILFCLIFLTIKIIKMYKLNFTENFSKILTINLLLFFIFSIIFYRFNFTFNLENKILELIINKSFLLSLYLLINVIVLFNVNSKLSINKFKNYFFLYSFLPTILFFTLFYSNNIFYFTIHAVGNDWLAFDNFAHKILLGGEFIRAGEDFFYFRPLMRYIFAFLYMIFGQNFFPFQMFEVLLILTSSYVLFNITSKYNSIFNAYLLSQIFLIFIFGETFKIHLGKGLTEYYSLAFLSLFILGIYKFKNSIAYLILISFIGAMGFWLREDHLPVTLTCSILILRKFSFQDITSINFRKNLKIFCFLCFILLFYFSLIGFRNLFVGGNFQISHFQVGKITEFDDIIINNLYPIIFGSNLNDIPRTFSIIIIFSIFYSLYLLVKYLIKFNSEKLSLIVFPLIFLSSIIPYFYVANSGYPPRYSIHIFYLSLFVISKIDYKGLFEKINIIKKNNFNLNL